MNRPVAFAGLVGVALFAAGMTIALTGADPQARIVGSAVMVAGLAAVLVASFSWASRPSTAAPRARRRSTQRSGIALPRLHHAPEGMAVPGQSAGRR